MATGRLTPPFERHHLEHPRRDYETVLQKAVRNHSGMIIPAHTINHRLLHLRVKPNGVPSNWLLSEMFERLHSYESSKGGYAQAIRLAGDLQMLGDTLYSPDKANEAYNHAFYLIRNIGYATMSSVDAEMALRSQTLDKHGQPEGIH
ncbi:MAG: hypothetical protein WCJ60_01700 [bacterium]